MAPDGSDQAINLSEDSLAVPLALRLATGVGHFHAQPIDPTDELLGRFHAMLQALLANEAHPFHQRASRITQQDPIDWVMEIGGQASGIQETEIQIQRFFQVKLFRLLSSGLDQLIDPLVNLLLRPPDRIALQSTFGRHRYGCDRAEATEILQEQTVGQAHGKGAEVLIEQRAGDIATQSSAAMELTGLLGLGAEVLVLIAPGLEVGLDELVFQAALEQ